MVGKQRKILEAAHLLKLLAHPVRLSILCNLLHKGEMSVGDLLEAEKGTVSQSQLSQFLGKMRAEKLVVSRKEGQTVYYSIKSPAARHIVETLYKLFCG